MGGLSRIEVGRGRAKDGGEAFGERAAARVARALSPRVSRRAKRRRSAATTMLLLVVRVDVRRVGKDRSASGGGEVGAVGSGDGRRGEAGWRKTGRGDVTGRERVRDVDVRAFEARLLVVLGDWGLALSLRRGVCIPRTLVQNDMTSCE